MSDLEKMRNLEWEKDIEYDGKRAGIDTRGIVGMAIVHAMVDKIAELEKENARLRKVLNKELVCPSKDKIMEVVMKVLDRKFTRTCWSEEIALAMLREIGKIQNEGERWKE